MPRRRSEYGRAPDPHRGLRASGDYDQNVFINCPFDAQYRQMMWAIVFAVVDCGFVPRSALEVHDGCEVRIDKIKRIIRQCRHGIHDISRVQLDIGSGLPRFNMPLELGLFLGAQEYGTRQQRWKRCLVMDSEPYRYQIACSDIAGQDIDSHGGKPSGVIAVVRNWLATFLADDGILVPDQERLRDRYERFCAELPEMCEEIGLDPDRLLFVEMRTLAEEWADLNPVAVPRAAKTRGVEKPAIFR
jgi:hypothetical protein